MDKERTVKDIIKDMHKELDKIQKKIYNTDDEKPKEERTKEDE